VLEKAISANKPSEELDPALSEFTKTLSEFLSNLSSALVPEAAPIVSNGDTPPDAEKIRKTVEEMIGYLENMDPAAGDCLEANKSTFVTILGADNFRTFEREVEGFSYDNALSLLRQTADK
jgi:hypothetical protein